jgi:hypothetical protein
MAENGKLLGLMGEMVMKQYQMVTMLKPLKIRGSFLSRQTKS